MLRSTIIVGRSYGRVRRNWENRAPTVTFFDGRNHERHIRAREILEDAADRWWIFLLTGIAWLVFALIVFQWDYIYGRPRSRTCSASSPSSPE